MSWPLPKFHFSQRENMLIRAFLELSTLKTTYMLNHKIILLFIKHKKHVLNDSRKKDKKAIFLIFQALNDDGFEEVFEAKKFKYEIYFKHLIREWDR